MASSLNAFIFVSSTVLNCELQSDAIDSVAVDPDMSCSRMECGVMLYSSWKADILRLFCPM